MRVIVSPTELHIDPVLCRSGAIVVVFLLMKKGRLGDLPLESSEK